MTTLSRAVDQILSAQQATRKPLAVILAGHNGSGKSTLWRRALSDQLQIPLINADRMMLSILPEPGDDGLAPWAMTLRDTDRGWMGVAQQGVNAFAGHAMAAQVPFAMETVFSYWEPQPDGQIRSKIDLIVQLQAAGYFVLMIFVGLASVELSILRVQTRVSEGGHTIDQATLRKRFTKTQTAIAAALPIADAAILTDNSPGSDQAFTMARVQLGGGSVLYDRRLNGKPAPPAMRAWLDVIAPLAA